MTSLNEMSPLERVERLKEAVAAWSQAEEDFHDERLIRNRTRQLQRLRKKIREKHNPSTNTDYFQLSARQTVIVRLEEDRRVLRNHFESLLGIIRTPN